MAVGEECEVCTARAVLGKVADKACVFKAAEDTAEEAWAFKDPLDEVDAVCRCSVAVVDAVVDRLDQKGRDKCSQDRDVSFVEVLAVRVRDVQFVKAGWTAEDKGDLASVGAVDYSPGQVTGRCTDK